MAHWFVNTTTLTHPHHGEVVLVWRMWTGKLVAGHVTPLGGNTTCMTPKQLSFLMKGYGIDIEGGSDEKNN